MACPAAGTQAAHMIAVAAFLILTSVLAGLVAVLIGAFIHHGNPTSEIEAADWDQWEQEVDQP